eukprot:TRINITY_DN28369_c0_g1_i1.p1 TRINITY_DN28369_c0_g1~~TRINITY_DN28369_c0_g1_i1.p1  ORF type:complete len:1204 (+),score=282.62 TRINITY_DN28369_c0_g1_i1:72-3683(+)
MAESTEQVGALKALIGSQSEAAIAQPPQDVTHQLIQALQQLKGSVDQLREQRKGEEEEEDWPWETLSMLDYQNSWPELEVSVVMHEILRFDLLESTFDADFTVHVDWLDPKLKRGEHYDFDAQEGRFELAPPLARCKNELAFFNPDITVENSNMEPETADNLPLITEEIFMEEFGGDVPWLHKSYRFIGTLQCRQADARQFPFDIQGLRVKIAGRPMKGTTSLGQARQLKLIEPHLQTEWHRKEMLNASKIKHKKTQLAFLPTSFHEAPSSSSENAVAAHLWKVSDDGSSTLDVGEMIVVGMGGARHFSGGYQVYIVLKRRWYPRYVIEMSITIVQVLMACFSAFVPFNEDMLANRLSITLTIALTVVAASSQRPAPIEGVPYETVYDMFNRSMILVVVMIGIGNVYVFNNCWGTYRDEGSDDFYDTTLKMVVSNIREQAWPDQTWCQPNVWVYNASYLDGVLIGLTFTALAMILITMTVRAQMVRLSMWLQIKHEIDSDDPAPGEYSKLLHCHAKGGFFEFIKRENLLEFARRVAVVPGIRWFWGLWRCLRSLSRCKWCKKRNTSGELAASSTPETFHACDAERLLQEATEKVKASKEEVAGISTCRVKLSTLERFYVLDVGSGEIGFYSYWFDPEICCVRVSGLGSKLSFKEGQTFLQMFVEAHTGAEALYREVVDRYDLKEAQPSRSSLRMSATGIGGNPSGELILPGEMDSSPLSPGGPDSPVKAYDEESPGRPSPTSRESSSSQPRLSREQTFSRKTMQFQESMKSRAKAAMAGGAAGAGNLVKVFGNVNALATSGLSNSTTSTVRKQTLIMGLTGINRQSLRDDENGRAQLDCLIQSLNGKFDSYRLEVVAYSPHGEDEAMYELLATEWLLQWGDLDVGTMKLSANFKTVGGGHHDAQVGWDEVQRECSILKADKELKAAYCEAGEPKEGADSESPSKWSLPRSVRVGPFYEAFERRPTLMRAMVRAKLFTGTISAGSGSCQTTVRSTGANLESSQVHSLPLGNRTPLVGMTLTSGHNETLVGTHLPKTRRLVEQLLLKEPLGKAQSTRPAWEDEKVPDKEKLDLWFELVQTCAEEHGLPRDLRGLFVGITAVWYAAKAAKVDSKIMARDEFLFALDEQRTVLMSQGGKGCGRTLANITLVMAFVSYSLHRSAQVVCKRNWKVGDPANDRGVEFAATWTLGMYLKTSGVMSLPMFQD